MDYVINYGETGSLRVKKKEKHHPVKMRWSMLVFAVVLLLLVGGNNRALDILLPGDSAVTAAALQGMVTDLSNGTAFFDAFFAFCREILDGAY